MNTTTFLYGLIGFFFGFLLSIAIQVTSPLDYIALGLAVAVWVMATTTVMSRVHKP